MTKEQLKKLIQEAVKEQLSRKAAPLPTWGVHSTPEKSPWGIKEPSEWYPEDDGSEDSDLEPFPWEQEVYDKHNASMSEQLATVNDKRHQANRALWKALQQNPEMPAEDLVVVAANFLSNPDEIEEITLTALEKWGEPPLPKRSPEDARRREWDQNNDDGTIYGEQLDQTSEASRKLHTAASRIRDEKQETIERSRKLQLQLSNLLQGVVTPLGGIRYIAADNKGEFMAIMQNGSKRSVAELLDAVKKDDTEW